MKTKKLPLPKLKRGDKGKWSSQSNGITKLKRGTVSHVAPSGSAPRLASLLNNYSVRSSVFSSYSARKSKSFVVAVPQKKGRLPIAYWPLSSYLRKN